MNFRIENICRHLLLPALLFACFAAQAQKKKDHALLVNPFIGTSGHGHTYPGVVVPFGMVQLSPDTRLEGWDSANYKVFSTQCTKVAVDNLNIQTQEFSAPLNTKSRFIKVVAHQYGALPQWHESAGKPSYIFADEITIEQ